MKSKYTKSIKDSKNIYLASFYYHCQFPPANVVIFDTVENK